MSHGVESGGITPAIIIYGLSIAEMDTAQRQALAESLAATAGARAMVGAVDLSDYAALYERKAAGLTVDEEVPPFTFLFRPDPKQYPSYGNKPDYRAAIAAVSDYAPGTIEDHDCTVKALAAVFHHGKQWQGPSLFAFPEAPWLRANRMRAITFSNPQAIVDHAAREDNLIPMLGPKGTRALGLFIIASTRTRFV